MSTYCFKCNTVHGNNYFPLVVPDKSASIKEFKKFAKQCGCIACTNSLYNIQLCAEVYVRQNKIRDRFWGEWKNWMRLNMKSHYENMKKNVLLHVIEGCNQQGIAEDKA